MDPLSRPLPPADTLWLERRFGGLASLGLALLCLVVSVTVISRWLYRGIVPDDVLWVQELMLVVVLAPLGLVTAAREHIEVTIFTEKAGHKAKRRADLPGARGGIVLRHHPGACRLAPLRVRLGLRRILRRRRPGTALDRLRPLPPGIPGLRPQAGSHAGQGPPWRSGLRWCLGFSVTNPTRRHPPASTGGSIAALPSLWIVVLRSSRRTTQMVVVGKVPQRRDGPEKPLLCSLNPRA